MGKGWVTKVVGGDVLVGGQRDGLKGCCWWCISGLGKGGVVKFVVVVALCFFRGSCCCISG